MELVDLGCVPRKDHPAIGNMMDNSQVTTAPTSDRINSSTVHVLRVSLSVNPLSRLTTQNPLSFIQEMPIAPKPMDKKRYME